MIWATLLSVTDGDTISVKIDGCPLEGMKVRLIGVDTPERGECFWADARDRSKELVLGQRVARLRDISEYDSWNRLLRHVYLADETWANAVLFTEGWARATTYEPDHKTQSPSRPGYSRTAKQAGSDRQGLRTWPQMTSRRRNGLRCSG